MKSKYIHIHSLIGQTQIKKEISFFLDGYYKTNYYPNSILCGPRGLGKTAIARAIASELKNIELKKGNIQGKKFLEVNAVELKSAEIFFTQIVPHILENQYITLFIDEVSELPLSVQKVFLTILNPTENHVTEYCEANGEKHIFDFTKITFISATTNPSGLHPDLLDRLRRFEMEDYAPQELADIIQQKLSNIEFVGSALERLSETLRGNARQAVHRANDIQTMGVKKFGDKEFDKLAETLSIYPLGLNKLEIKYLQELNRKGRSSLTDLCSRLSLTKEAVINDIEVYPRKQGLIAVEKSGRLITNLGRKIIKEVENS